MRLVIRCKVSTTDPDHWGTSRILGVAGTTVCAEHPQRFPALVYVVQADQATVEYAFEVCCEGSSLTLSRAIESP
jgi:hypothetical protein